MAIFECSGDVRYAESGKECLADRDLELGDDPGGVKTNARIDIMEDRVLQLFASFENFQQLVVAQSNTFAVVMGGSSDVDDRLTHIFEALRQKVALMLQKPIPGGDEEDHFDRGHNGCFSIEVDCTHEQFRRLCRLVRSTISGVWLHPPYAKAQFDERGNTDFEIQFHSHVDLASLLGITRTKDLLTMLRLGTGNCGDKSSDVAVRLLGTCFINDEDKNSPAAILAGQTLHVGCLEDRVTALYRDSHEFDMRLMSYRHPLRSEKDTVEGLVKRVCQSRISYYRNEIQKRTVQEIVNETRKFSMRGVSYLTLVVSSGPSRS